MLNKPYHNQALILKVLAAYGLETKAIRILQPQTGYRNNIIPLELKDEKKLALIFYKNEPDILPKIKTANLVSNYLARQGWPTRQTYSGLTNTPGTAAHKAANNKKAGRLKSILQITHSNSKYYCCLYNYLPGSTINWDNYTMKHIKLLGQVLGQLHHDLAAFKPKQFNLIKRERLILEEKLNVMNTYFYKEGVQKALKEKLKLNPKLNVFPYLQQVLKNLTNLPNQQILHLDFVRGNILFQNKPYTFVQKNPAAKKFILDPQKTRQKNQTNHNQSSPDDNQSSQELLTVSGILDFEKAALGPRVLDVARTLAFLLIDCQYKTELQVKKYFLNSGYAKRGQQQLPEPKLLQSLTTFFLFYDFYKFLRHNPYQFLPQNEHFVRTKNWLLKQNLLSTSNNSS